MYYAFSEFMMGNGEDEGLAKSELELWLDDNIRPEHWENVDRSDINKINRVIGNYLEWVWESEDAWLIEFDGCKW